MSFNKKKIADIVDNNYVNASVLYYFGISFFDYSEETLEQACIEKGLDVKMVVKKLEADPNSGPGDFLALQEYPIDLIIEYLKHTHFIFIKQKLPYLAQLIKNSSLKAEDYYTAIAKDLKFVFPLFVEDFIHHIYEEEDTLFSYIASLNDYLNGGGNPSVMYWKMENNSLQKFAMEHEQHDDEMRGIRNITNDYELVEGASLPIKVIYSELQTLEEDLKTHARIENEVLFPKALQLEKEAILKFQSKIKLN
ncbi:iron-sulfur cluster repair di-iron protein [Fulvivirga sp. RKSG066]|uniref:hemerythrin domain-containing protein n=1 Tax=Fulvivirga aurantia TaxID=2529383 RepID=UPI0012BD296F|nr:hemerythrin domain-containing protein [Fulvivirga aurantia]MTI21798.1 iron-sulfur cluster repair di-iron protein [Fulvivirga aurantia]